jgi:soluble lytic murein transglycosylase-like protein
LAVMAIESNFHPYIQSKVGAQGLMQVMPKVHAQRYEEFGGKLAAFDPITNLRVGVSVLVEGAVHQFSAYELRIVEKGVSL